MNPIYLESEGKKSPGPPPIARDIRNISKTKTETHSFAALIIENLSVALSWTVKSQSWTKSNRDLLSNIAISRDGAI
jgi:hypothetical protein